MASRSNLACKESWDSETVIRAPSTKGGVGVVVSPLARKPKILCDWFQGTMTASCADAVIAKCSVEFGCANECTRIPNGMASYRRVLQFADGVRLFLDNRYADTCCVILSGSAEPTRHLQLIRELTQLGVRATRIDLAFDDRRGVLAPSAVFHAIQSRTLVSRWKKSRWIEEANNASGARLSQGFQIGSKSSSSYLSTYDKGLETETESECDWVRWELRLAGDEAQQFVECFFDDNPKSTEDDLRQHVAKAKEIQGVLFYDDTQMPIFEGELSSELVDRFKRLALNELKKRLSFRDRTTSLNTSRASVLLWWEQFLEYFDPINSSDSFDDDLEYEEAVRLQNLKRRREFSARQQTEEVLTEVYEKHISPHKLSFEACRSPQLWPMTDLPKC